MKTRVQSAKATLLRTLPLAAAMFIMLLSAGCTMLHAGPGRHPDGFGYEGIINGYASIADLRDYDGDILCVDILNDNQANGELINVDIWPLVGVGVGLVGVRAHVVSLGAGVGLLFYDPQPANSDFFKKTAVKGSVE